MFRPTPVKSNAMASDSSSNLVQRVPLAQNVIDSSW